MKVANVKVCQYSVILSPAWALQLCYDMAHLLVTLLTVTKLTNLPGIHCEEASLPPRVSNKQLILTLLLAKAFDQTHSKVWHRTLVEADPR